MMKGRRKVKLNKEKRKKKENEKNTAIALKVPMPYATIRTTGGRVHWSTQHARPSWKGSKVEDQYHRLKR